MKRKIFLIVVLLLSFNSFSQKKEDIFGTWELISTLNVPKTNIDIGELVLEDEEDVPKLDSIQKALEQRKIDDPRITKWHYIFEKDYLYEYRYEIGGKFRSKIFNNSIYKFNQPFYEIISLKGDTLELREIHSKVIRILRKVDTDLSDFVILPEIKTD
jgi:hypothetical protein